MATTMMSFLPIFFGGLATILGLIYVYFKYVIYTHWTKRNVPQDEATVPFGHFGPVINGTLNSGELYKHMYDRYKKHRYFGSYALFVPNLAICDPELIKIVLTKEFQHFHDRNFFCNEEVDPLSGHLFLSKGAKWKNMRVKLTPTFTSGKMKMMFHIVKSCGEELNAYLNERQGQDVDIKEIFARFTTDSIMSTAFGVKCNSLTNPDCAFRYWGKKVLEPKPVWNLFFTFCPKVLDIFRIPYYGKDVANFFTSVFEETFKVRLNEKKRLKRDFLDLLMDLINDGCITDENGNKPKISNSTDGKMTMTDGVAQAFVYFLAGYETSSSTATFCLYELACNLEMQEKVRKEMQATLKKYGGITYESMNELPYLTKVISETLRKYPTLMFLNRVCTKAIDLPTTNLHIEKGTDILIPVLGLHMDPDIYPDPLKFDPERFSEEGLASRHPYSYLPFGEGPRICIGMRFGIVQTKVAIVNTLISNRVSLSKNTLPLRMDPGSFVYSTLDPITLCLTPL